MCVCVVCSTGVGLAVVVVTNGSHCSFQSVAHKIAFHGVPCQVVLCNGEPSRVVCEIDVSVNFSWMKVYVDVVFPSLGPSSLILLG